MTDSPITVTLTVERADLPGRPRETWSKLMPAGPREQFEPLLLSREGMYANHFHLFTLACVHGGRAYYAPLRLKADSALYVALPNWGFVRDAAPALELLAPEYFAQAVYKDSYLTSVEGAPTREAALQALRTALAEGTLSVEIEAETRHETGQFADHALLLTHQQRLLDLGLVPELVVGLVADLKADLDRLLNPEPGADDVVDIQVHDLPEAS